MGLQSELKNSKKELKLARAASPVPTTSLMVRSK